MEKRIVDNRPQQYEQESPEKMVLPVDAYEQAITDAVLSHKVTIIDAATGAGKSTRVPRFLYDTGKFDRIIMTQPRIMASRNVSERLASELTMDGQDGGALVGYKTAHEGNAQATNKILVATDGLVLRKQLESDEITSDTVIVIDEFHERNKNMDVALALCFEKNIRVVVMSATLDIQRLESYCKSVVGESEVTKLHVPGRTYPVTAHIEQEDKERPMSETVFRQSAQGKNVLAFVPGRKEARDLEGRLRRMFGNRAPVILQLNGDQTPEEQQLCMQHYESGKIIISTSVGQTSITIDDIDTVVDSGWERTGNYTRGVHAIPLQPCSSATRDQRMGRVGRTKPGEYFMARLDNGPSVDEYKHDAMEFDTPEILRANLGDVALRLAMNGYDLQQLPLLDTPKNAEIGRTHDQLRRLGALAIDTVTGEGEQMSRYAMDAHLARMVVEAEKHSPEVHQLMIAAASALQVHGILSTEAGNDRWRNYITTDYKSDVIVQLHAFIMAMGMDSYERQTMGIVEQRYLKAMKYYSAIVEEIGRDTTDISLPTPEQAEALVRSIVAGSDEIFRCTSMVGAGKYQGYIGGARRLSRGTTIAPHRDTLLVGMPLDLGKMTKKQVSNEKLLVNLTAVSLQQLVDWLPEDRVQKRPVRNVVKSNGEIVTHYEVSVDGHVMPGTLGEKPAMSPEAVRVGLKEILNHFMSDEAMEYADAIELAQMQEIQAALQELVALQHRSDDNLRIAEQIDEIIEEIVERYDGVGETAHVSRLARMIPEVQRIAAVVQNDVRERITQTAPEFVQVAKVNVPVQYVYDAVLRRSVANVDISANELLAMTDADLDDLTAQLHGRLVLFRASDYLGSSAKYRSFESAREYYSRLSRESRRGTPAPRTIDPRASHALSDEAKKKVRDAELNRRRK